MKSLQGFLPVAVAFAVACLMASAGSCTQPAAPQLVRVLDATPREIEVGDKIEIAGDGFPAGKPARVTFRGALNRPSERPVRGAEIVLAGTARSSTQVEVPFGEATEALFCGTGEAAIHTTFEGDLEVAFASAVPGAPPVAGALQSMTLDVRPSANAADLVRDRDGERVLALLGLHVAPPTPGRPGLLVQTVELGSRGQASGIGAGDVLTRFDGVRIASAGDLVPTSGEREAAVGMRQAGSSGEVQRSVPVDGFRRAPPGELVGLALAILVALAAVALFAVPVPAPVAAFLQRAAFRLRARVLAGAVRGPTWRRLADALGAVAREALPPLHGARAPIVLDAAACSALAAMPFGQYLVAAKLDVGLLLVGAASVLAMAALATGDSMWRGARAAVRVFWQHVPAAGAIAAVVAMTGSVRMQEIEHVQGGWPWDWLVFRSPAALVSLVVLLACARIEPDPGPPSLGLGPFVAGPAPAPGARKRPWLEAACRVHRVVIAGLGATLFLGGWLLPGLSPAVQDARPWLELLGAAWMLAKTFALVVAMAWVHWVLPRPRLAESTRSTAVWGLPISMAALAAAAAWSRSSLAGAWQPLVSEGMVAAVALASAALFDRLWHVLRSPSAGGRVSEFL